LNRLDVTNVTIDDFAAGQTIGRHLKETGCETIGWISLPPSHKRANQRELGLANVLRKFGGFEETFMCEGDGTFESGYKIGMKILSSKRRPSAIFAGNDYMGLGVLSAARELGLNIPSDVAVCGFDGGEVSSLANPSLTTIKQPIAEIGEKAAKLLLRKLEFKETPMGVVNLNFDLIKGNSSGAK